MKEYVARLKVDIKKLEKRFKDKERQNCMVEEDTLSFLIRAQEKELSSVKQMNDLNC